jgi:hypothetical protein
MRSILVLSALLLVPGSASPQEPPPAPPANWGPMSINLEDVPYPHPVHIGNVGHNSQFESPQLIYPPLLRFLKGEDVGTLKGTR